MVFKKTDIENNTGYIFLVTNKHVIKGRNIINIRVTLKDGSIKNENVVLNDGKKQHYFKHKNDNIDIAIILLSGGYIEDNLDKIRCFDIDEDAYTSVQYLDNGGFEGSTVFMLGFPLGLIDGYSTTPVCRKGCVASMNKADITNKYSYILDIQNFPGNSGSPIISCPDSVSIGNTRSINKCCLIGIVHSYIPYKESLVNTQTNEIVEVRTENSWLALAHPIEFLKEMIDEFLNFKK